MAVALFEAAAVGLVASIERHARPAPLTAWRLLTRLLRPRVARLLAGVLCLAGLGVVGALYAYLTGPLLQALLSGGHQGTGYFVQLLPGLDPAQLLPRTSMLLVAAVLVLLAAFKGLLQLTQSWLLGGVVERIGHDLRVRLYDQLLRMPMREHRRHARGELLARLIDDTRRFQQAVVEGPLMAAREALALVGLLVVAVWLAPLLAVVAAAVLPVVALTVAMLSRRLRRAASKSQGALGELAGRAQSTLCAVREVKLCGAEEREVARMSVPSRRAARWAVRGLVVRATAPLFNEVSAALGLGAVLYLGASMAAAGTLSTERMVSFMAAVLMMYRPIKGLSQAAHLVAAGRASLDRVLELLQLPEDAASGPTAPFGDGHPVGPRELALSELCFRYEGASHAVVHRVSLTLCVDEIVAITGASGCGKSTLLDLLCGLEPWDRGRLLLDGQDCTREGGGSPLARLRAQAALVSQQPLMLDGTVAENLRYGAPESAEAALWGALETVGLAGRIGTLPAGVQTRMGSGGAGLSVGEIQRLAIARALLRRAPLLALDEPTSALDAANERLLLAVLTRVRRGRMVVVVSHSARVLAVAHRVLRLCDGRLTPVASGELLHDAVPVVAHQGSHRSDVRVARVVG